MNNDLIVENNIEINGKAEAIWDALTNPEKVKIYLYGTNLICDWQVGNPIVFQGEYQSQEYRDKGTLVQLEKNKLISYSYWSGFSGMEDLPENYALVTYVIDEAGEGCNLSVSQKGYASEESQKHSDAGWKQVLASIKEIVEKE